jgi:CHAT domain-containing protein
MEDPVSIPNAAGAKLFDAVLRPVRSAISAGSRVIVVPDGPLHSVNFETLVVSDPVPHYWIEDVVLSVAPSLGLLSADLGAQLPPDAKVLLIGDPIQADSLYPALRFASEELNSIRDRYPNAVQYVRAKATPSIYRQALPGEFAVIHFAAHAEANRSSPLDSAIILSPEQVSYKLYSRDVLETPISAALVTLSACRGAGARTYSGEGLVGFSWAFLDAGARNVIAGLWDVSDRSTARIMQELYRNLREKGIEAAESLRLAKLTLLQSKGVEARPWHWGPFQVYTRVWRPAVVLQAQRTRRSP